MNQMTNNRLAAYDRFMRMTPGSGIEPAEDAFCDGCKFHRRRWKYRFCLYTECPYMKGMKTFREEVYADGQLDRLRR